MKKFTNESLDGAGVLVVEKYYQILYSVFREEGKNADALEMLLEICYLNLSGVKIQIFLDNYRGKKDLKKKLKETFAYSVTISSETLELLKKFKELYDRKLIDQLYEEPLPVQICEKELFCEIIEASMEGRLDREAVAEKLRERYDRYVDTL